MGEKKHFFQLYVFSANTMGEYISLNIAFSVCVCVYVYMSWWEGAGSIWVCLPEWEDVSLQLVFQPRLGK